MLGGEEELSKEDEDKLDSLDATLKEILNGYVSQTSRN